jgi:soluble lytic murein transglycosylase-like protein
MGVQSVVAQPVRAIVIFVLATMAFGSARDASAQIYAWRDSKGTLVLSDRQINAPTAVYEVAGAPSYRTTTPVERPRAEASFDDLVLEHSQRHALRPELVRAVIQVESGFNPRATSPKGAMGLMQLMPGTARALGVVNPYDPAENIRGGTLYLRQLLDRYDGDERLALAAYNAGPGAVDRYGQTVPPYRETRDYVRRIGLKAGTGTGVTSGVTKRTIYKSIEVVNGRAIPRYSNERPESGTFEIVRN